MRVSPRSIAKWLALAYAAAVLGFVLWNSDASDVGILEFAFLPWIVGPAALAAYSVKISATPAGAWAFLALEAGIIAFTFVSWAYLIFVVPDAQNGIVMALFVPVLEFGAALVFMVVASLLGWRAAERPKTPT